MSAVYQRGTAANYLTVDQTAHGFNVGDPVRFNGTQYVLAQADNATNTAMGVVATVEPNAFNLVMNGMMNWPGHGFAIGTYQYLSDTNAGQYVPVPPGGGSIPVTVLKATSAATVQVLSQGPLEAGAGGGAGGVFFQDTVPAATPNDTWVSFMEIDVSGQSLGFKLTFRARGNRYPAQTYEITAGVNPGVVISLVSNAFRFATGVGIALRAVEVGNRRYNLEFLIGTTNGSNTRVEITATSFMPAYTPVLGPFDYNPPVGPVKTEIRIPSTYAGAIFDRAPLVSTETFDYADCPQNGLVTKQWVGDEITAAVGKAESTDYLYLPIVNGIVLPPATHVTILNFPIPANMRNKDLQLDLTLQMTRAAGTTTVPIWVRTQGTGFPRNYYAGLSAATINGVIRYGMFATFNNVFAGPNDTNVIIQVRSEIAQLVTQTNADAASVGILRTAGAKRN